MKNKMRRHQEENCEHRDYELPYGWQPIETAPEGVDVLVSAGPARNPGAVAVTIAHKNECGGWDSQFNTSSYMGAKYWQPLPEVPSESLPVPYAGNTFFKVGEQLEAAIEGKL
jgi:hypothetical protein